jgi:c-di-GMP-binding flagellar brake protein YcgR
MNGEQTYQSSIIETLIKQIKEEESRFDFDMRSAKREKIFLPVDIRSLESNSEVRGFSRDISTGGVCLVSEVAIPIGSCRLLRFLRHNSTTCEITANCKWAKSLGHGYTLSGWEFVEAVYG